MRHQSRHEALACGRTCTSVVLLTGLLVAQTTWYVDATAFGSGSGSQASPFSRIQDGIDAALVEHPTDPELLTLAVSALRDAGRSADAQAYENRLSRSRN